MNRNATRVASGRLRFLLVPIDLTPGSDRVLGRISLLPLADDSRVTLLHVVPGSLPPREQRNAARDASKALAEEVRHLRKSLPKNVSIEPEVRLGAAAKEIGACATKVKAELIVMGRGGGRVLRDAFLGSTAERVIRQARLPVLVVRLPPRTTYRRPALALDLDLAAHGIIRLMFLVLSSPRRRVAVIHAFHIPYLGLYYPSHTEDEIEETKDELHLRATLARLLAAALADANVPPEYAPSWEIHVRRGAPRSIVMKFTKETETDLLVLGTHGYSGPAHHFLGTVAGSLLRESKCDVLVVPPTPSRK